MRRNLETPTGERCRDGDPGAPQPLDRAHALLAEATRRVEALNRRLADRDGHARELARQLEEERRRHEVARLEATGARAGLEALRQELESLARSRAWRATAPARWLAWLLREWRLADPRTRQEQARAIAKLIVDPQTVRRAYFFARSRWFDEASYREAVPGLPPGRLSALRHFVREGERRAIPAHPLFDAAYYVRQTPGIPPGMSALTYWIRRGQYEATPPHPLFDQRRYLTLYPDVAASGHAALAHYLDAGWREGRSPHPLFDVEWYLATNPDVRASGAEPLTHYATRGWRERRPPHALFDPGFYLDLNPDVRQSGAEPLSHYVVDGAREGRSPHPLFDAAFYREAYPDIGDEDPLQHFLRWGWREQRQPHRMFDTSWYRAEYLAGQDINPLLHFVTEGRAAGHATNRWRLPIPEAVPGPGADDAQSRRHTAMASPPEGSGRLAPRALVLDACTPTPDRDSGSADAFLYMRLLRDLGWDVTFAPVDNFLWFGPYTRALEDMGVACLDAPRVRRLDTWLDRQGDVFDLVMLWRLDTARGHLEAVRAFCPRARAMFVTVDLQSVRLDRQARLAGDAVAVAHARDVAASELEVVDRVDMTIAISDVEADILRRQRPRALVRTLPIVRPLPGRRAAHAERRDIAFIGGYRHPPNVDAVHFFVEAIWPAVRAAVPEARFLIVGSEAPPSIREMAGNGVVYRGHVPDLAEVLDAVRLTVAPLRFGAGQKGKVVSSLSHGVPVVLTTVAAEGMGLADGTHALIRDTPAAFAEAVVRAYGDAGLWTRLSDEGLDLARRAFSLEHGRDVLIEALGALDLPAGTGAGSAVSHGTSRHTEGTA